MLGGAGSGACARLCCARLQSWAAAERPRVRGAILQSLVLPRLTLTWWFLHKIANWGCRWSSTDMGVCGVTCLPASYRHCGRAGWV